MLEVFIPMLMAAIVDGGLNRKSDFVLKEFFSPELIADQNLFILTLGGLMVLSALLSLTFGMIAARTAAVASLGFAKNLRRSVFNKVQSFSFANTDRFSTPSLIMRATTDVNNIQNIFQQVIRGLVRSPIMMVMAAVMAFRVDPELPTIFVFAIPVLALTLIVLMKWGYPRFSQMLKSYDKMNSDVQENLISSRVVKAYVRGDYEQQKFEESNAKLRKNMVRANKLFAYSNPIQMFVMWGCALTLYFLGGNKVMAGHLGTGELTSLISYNTQIISSLAMVTFMVMGLSMTRVSLSRVNEVLDEVTDITDTGDPELHVGSGKVEFRNVNFSYSKNPDNLTLHNINLSIESGETVGIVGGTGEGKSTLVQLIPRFYDALTGTVLIDSRDIKEYSLFELRESISMVLQKNMLFSGSIKENLLWGNANATDDEIMTAAKHAQAHDFIMSFPDGYDTQLGQGGVNVSGGQKQRLCIARALLKKPKILILDDSTSAVDTATDERIRTALRTELSHITKIIIAQRIASVIEADKIVVMDKGTITDVGTHDELMVRSSIYREIYESQMEEGK
ncbi:MAG: ABC transporter ATP-binding protein [Clostridia bacterium]|nr:ABC transporter ATP-binding protein [Clostridia bacterium]